MKVKIVKYSKDYCWYKDKVGEVFEVNYCEYANSYYKVKNGYNCIYKEDAVPIIEINYGLDRGLLSTFCPYGFNKLVGSVSCKECKFNHEVNTESKIVLCSWQKEEEDKMDLKSIAVKFENVEQREEIALVFENNGLQLTEGLDEYKNGTIGYIESGQYVSILTEYGMRDKKIIPYEEFIGGKEMKRLDVRKEYRDSSILVVPKINANDYILISTYLNKQETTTIRVGKDYLTSLARVNAMLKALELNYELYESVYWGEIEENTRVSVLDKNGIWDGYNGKFLKYIPDIKKVIVRVGDEVKVVDEYKVELCD